MFMQFTPSNAHSRNPENTLQNKVMVPLTTPASRAAHNHEGLKTQPSLVAHQSPDQDGLHKIDLEPNTDALGEPLCQRILGLLSECASTPDFQCPEYENGVL